VRSRYLVTYDIRDGKRLRKVFIKMRGYGEAVQYSVFLCKLSPLEKMLMISDLLKIINHNEDSIFIINLGNTSKNDDIEFIGIRPDLTENRSIVV
jgi:CRISPR-associated protein Cas2